MSISRKKAGDIGEQEVVDLIRCPYCAKDLMKYGRNRALYDVHCSFCDFHAQIRSAKHRPTTQVPGSGWDILEKHLKAGHLPPSLIVNNRWREKGVERQEIRFYPFVPKKHIKHTLRDIRSEHRKYQMFTYINLDKLPSLELFKR